MSFLVSVSTPSRRAFAWAALNLVSAGLLLPLLTHSGSDEAAGTLYSSAPKVRTAAYNECCVDLIEGKYA
jgi:predicted dienelactone hydrolase